LVWKTNQERKKDALKFTTGAVENLLYFPINTAGKGMGFAAKEEMRKYDPTSTTK